MTSGWVALEVAGLLRSHADACSAALWANGAEGVQEGWLPGEAPRPRQPWDTGPDAPLPARCVLTAWFQGDVRRADVLRALRPWLDERAALAWRDEPEVDWEAESRASFRPIHAGPFVVAPPWDAPPGALVVEPGAGFGTGEHPTTRQALLLFAELGSPEGAAGTALDIGCGSGILALAAASCGWTAHGTDIDDAAVANARHNAGLNGLAVTFDLRAPDGLEPADLVFANLHGELLVKLAPDLLRLAKHTLILAGILEDREASVRTALPWPVDARLQDGEWVALRLLRPAR